MIEILEHGKTHRGKCCEECGCVFTYAAADTVKHFEPKGPVREIKCPECGKALIIETEDK